MAENMMNKEHKATNEDYRRGYEATFGKKESVCRCPPGDCDCEEGQCQD